MKELIYIRVDSLLLKMAISWALKREWAQDCHLTKDLNYLSIKEFDICASGVNLC